MGRGGSFSYTCESLVKRWNLAVCLELILTVMKASVKHDPVAYFAFGVWECVGTGGGGG